ncbi:MAG TPA: DNA topoisomerase IB [Roseomonas sp.]|jgi:DNA topoisomerase-1
MLPDQDPGLSSPVVDPRIAAEEANLTYVTDERPGITRRRAGTGFSYRLPGGGPVRDAAALRRIRALAVPPAWTEVWICPRMNGHIQATGRDQRGRKQYRYHARWRELRDAAKYDHMIEFAHALPAVRARVTADMAKPGLPREKVLAAIVHLLETTLIRVGNEDYARQNRSYGLTTLRSRHVTVDGAELRFTFKGKGGKTWQLRLQDRRVARVIRSCQELPGQELFQYREADGSLNDVSSSDVNAYLREITGREITAKDFRTWAGTVLAALALDEVRRFDSQAGAKRNIKAAIERVAARLGNTPTICRKCYVHPAILDSYLDGGFALGMEEEQARTQLREKLETLQPEEAAVLALLLERLNRERNAG